MKTQKMELVKTIGIFIIGYFIVVYGIKLIFLTLKGMFNIVNYFII